MKAPPLRTLNDWYLVHQLEKFKAGVGFPAANPPRQQKE